jgi:MtaA/CmuA family methyltransferase
MTYSDMDRFKDALEGKPRDRVPLFPMIAGWAAVNFSAFSLSHMARRPELIVEAQIKAKESLGYDSLYAYADPLYVPEAFGCRVRFLETGPLVDPLPLSAASIEDVHKLPEPDVRSDGRLPAILEVAKGLSAYGKGQIPVVGLFEGPFTTLCRLVEAERIMRMIYKNRSLLEGLLDRVNGFLLRFGRALIENGANTLLIPEPTASASMISPTMFRELVLPRLRTLTAELDVPCILHVCGDTTPLLEIMGESGAGVLSLDQCMDLSASRARVPRVALGGNVHPVDALLMGTREKVAENTRHCLHTAGASRFVLMTGCGVPPKTPIENVETMVQEAKAYALGPGLGLGGETS